MASREITSLDQLMDGAVKERFQKELEKVWNNIFDFRTNPKKPRTIALIFKFTPSERRDAASMIADVQVKLAQPEVLQQTVLMHLCDDGTVQVTEHTDQVPGQLDMEGSEAPIPNIVQFKRLDEPAQG
jgi:hypothetical protein